MATFRKRSRKFRNKNTRKSSIKRRGKKSLVGRVYMGGTSNEVNAAMIERERQADLRMENYWRGKGMMPPYEEGLRALESSGNDMDWEYARGYRYRHRPAV